MRGKLLTLVLVTLVASASVQWIFSAKAEMDLVMEENIESGLVAIVVGFDLSDYVSLIQVERLLEHQGLVYVVVPDTSLSLLGEEQFSAIIVMGSSEPSIGGSGNPIQNAVEGGAGLIWIGGELSDSSSLLLGVISEEQSTADLQTVKAIKYGDLSTPVFSETLYPISLVGASVQGFFVDEADRNLFPAETSFKRDNAGLAIYFAYDIAAWWFSDLSTPWLRAYRLYLALENVLSEHLVVRLAAYPRNLQSAFISRIEDVDPLHNSYEWLNRAGSYLDYYSARGAPLTVDLTPTYLDPSIGLSAKIGDEVASPLRTWLSKVIVKGGTIVQHGYTHQYDDYKTGVAPEFFNSDEQAWLSFEEQKNRIGEGADQIYSSLGFVPKGFEAPHYIANDDTYASLLSLGFNYITQNSNTPFFDRYELAEGLVNIPETLGYIPLDPPSNLEDQMKFNMDMLYDMSAPMLFFNHLFEDSAMQIGESLLDCSMEKQGVWLTSTEGLADFWLERLSAYKNMNVHVAGEGKVEIVLGQSHRAGLTLIFNKETEIKSLIVNGAECPVYDGSYAVLPILSNSANSVVIDLSNETANLNLPYGLFMVLVSVVFSSLHVRRERKRKTRMIVKGGRE